MGHSQRLTLSLAREVYRLVHELCELGNDPIQWRVHLLQRMCDIVGSDVGGAFMGPLRFDPAAIPAELFVPRNVPDAYLNFLQRRDITSDPANEFVMRNLQVGITDVSSDMCGSEVWVRSAHYNELLRPAKIEEYIISIVPIPKLNVFAGLTLMRMTDDRPFRRPQIIATELLAQELQNLWQKPALSPAPEWIDRLPPRLSQVLAFLMQGMAEKQIAFQTGLSQSTVHNHVSRLYRAAGVCSRGELMAAAVPKSSFRPQLFM